MSDRPPDDARSLVGRLYETYGASLYRYAVLLLADAAAAEDVVQQVFATILRQPQAPRLHEEAHYLRTAVRNECYSHLRRLRSQRQLGDERALIEPVREGGSREERIALERAIRDLPPEQREVIYLGGDRRARALAESILVLQQARSERATITMERVSAADGVQQ